MGHLPISGGHMAAWRFSEAYPPAQIYVHIHNTNDSPGGFTGTAAVRAAGCEIGHDGMEIIV